MPNSSVGWRPVEPNPMTPGSGPKVPTPVLSWSWCAPTPDPTVLAAGTRTSVRVPAARTVAGWAGESKTRSQMRWLAGVLAGAALMACGGDEGGDEVTVVASFYPVAEIASRVGGTLVDVT